MSSASAGDPLGYLKKQVEDLSDTLKAKNVVLDALMIKSEGKETEGTKKIEGIIADIKKELKEVEEKIARKEAEIAKERAEIARKEAEIAEPKQSTLVVVHLLNSLAVCVSILGNMKALTYFLCLAVQHLTLWLTEPMESCFKLTPPPGIPLVSSCRLSLQS